MKFILAFIFCTISLSASAQWWRVDLKLKKIQLPFTKHERPPAISQVKDHSIARLSSAPKPFNQQLSAGRLERSNYSIELEEAAMMKTAQHNMRFRIYNEASYNFSELARLFLLQNRFSEAKWYLLQSNKISRQQNDDKHTIANLIQLATIKASIGESPLAQQDLAEALQLAVSRGMKKEAADIQKLIHYIKVNKGNTTKADLRYAEAVENNIKGG